MEPEAEGGAGIEEHFDSIRANLIRCEECNENFFFDFLRHPRYFVTHFKTCHLKNVLYRFNGCSEEENQRVRFGPRRKKDATAWFGQLKSTEKRMISMQDNKWGEIAERECWSCRLCKHARKSSDMPHAFEPNELGRRQALLHLRQYHEAAYNAFLSMLPAVNSSHGRHRASGPFTSQGQEVAASSTSGSAYATGSLDIQSGGNAAQPAMTQIAAIAAPPPSTQSHEAERSRVRRMLATPESKKAEAERSKRRREQLTPAQRQADAERRTRKKRRIEERARSRQRRAEASPEAREREMQRSRDRRQNATEQQRRREAQRSRMRRQNASEEQRLRERERCRRRYEIKKQQKLLAQQSGAVYNAEVHPYTSAATASDSTTSPSSSTSEATYATPPPRSRVLPSDLERGTQHLQQQQAGLDLQMQSLYASLAFRPPR